jgi:hypothetical protein
MSRRVRIRKANYGYGEDDNKSGQISRLFSRGTENPTNKPKVNLTQPATVFESQPQRSHILLLQPAS